VGRKRKDFIFPISPSILWGSGKKKRRAPASLSKDPFARRKKRGIQGERGRGVTPRASRCHSSPTAKPRGEEGDHAILISLAESGSGKGTCLARHHGEGQEGKEPRYDGGQRRGGKHVSPRGLQADVVGPKGEKKVKEGKEESCACICAGGG